MENAMESALSQAGESAAAERAEEIESQAATGAEEIPEGQEEEKPVRTFTQDELDAKLAKSRNRNERRHAKELSELRAELSRLAEAQKERGEKPSAEGDKAPERKDFDSYEEYIEARADFKSGERIRKELETMNKSREKETTERKQADTQKELTNMANKRVLDGRKEYSDFDAVIQDAFDDGVISADSELYLGIIESDFGHRLAYHLAKNPDEAERINKLTARGVHRELGKLEDKFSKTPEKKKVETMDTLNGSNRIPKPNDPMRKDISMEEFVRIRNAQEQKRRGN